MNGRTAADLLGMPERDWVARRHANVSAFLAARDLDADWLGGFIRDRVGADRVLLTSSPVHGLANPTSDFDFIAIRAAALDGPRIATKIFERGHHLEVVSFSAAEVTRNLDELATLATRPPGEVVAGFRSWDRRFEPRRKQTERIVNGITLDGAMPYLSSLPALSTVWSSASLHTALEHVAYLCLAEAAGERRGRVGYAVNAVLHLADALLSGQGDVYTTRKWYLLRWVRADLARTARDPAVRDAARAVDALRAGVGAALGQPDAPLAPRYLEVGARVAEAVAGVRVSAVTVAARGPVEHHEFLPGAGLLIGPGGSVPVPGWPVPDAVDVPFDGLASLRPRDAAGLLRAIRAGLAAVAVTYDTATAPAMSRGRTG
jgi:hypothetical protein